VQLVGASLCVTNLQVLRFQTFAAHVSVTRQSHKHEPQTIFSVSTKYNCLRHTKSCYISSTRSLNMTWRSSCDHQQICLLILEGHTWSVIHLLMCPAVWLISFFIISPYQVLRFCRVLFMLKCQTWRWWAFLNKQTNNVEQGFVMFLFK